MLTAEVFQALEFLPRKPFITSVFEKVHALDDSNPFILPHEHATARFLLSPGGRFALRPDEPTHQSQIVVQFDGIIRTTD